MIVKGCEMYCYEDPRLYCVDQGEGIDPAERYKCISCSDVCPGPNDNIDISDVSWTCLDNCKGFLQLPVLDSMYSNQGTGFLGTSLASDITVLAVIVVLLVLVSALLVMFLLQRKKMKEISRRHQGDGRTSISGSSSTDLVPDTPVTPPLPSTITHVTVTQSHNGSPRSQQPSYLRRCHSETEMLLNSASVVDPPQSRDPVIHATDSIEGSNGSTEILKC